MKRKLKVNVGEVAFALEDNSWETNHYLDLETGQVITVMADTFRELEKLFEEAYDPEAKKPPDLAELLQQSNLQDWQQGELLVARQIEANSSRYLDISPDDRYEGYNDMGDFIFTVQDERLQAELWQAIRGRGAFRHFKDVLLQHPRERERWFAFKDELMRQRVADWLAEEEIELLET